MLETKGNFDIFRGCWREKVVSVFGFGRSKSHFRAPENRHFWHISRGHEILKTFWNFGAP